MKTSIINLFLLPALIAGLNLIPAGRVTAQTFTTLYNFIHGGMQPAGSLILSGGTLYGTASRGGSSGGGTVFAVNIFGGGFATLHNFNINNPSEGANPQAGLILSGNTLYGTTVRSFNLGFGTVFAVNTDGTGFATLYNFTDNLDGASPAGGLILSGSTLYGTAGAGGSSGNGTVFSINTNGTSFTTLYSFTASSTNSSSSYTNSDGASPASNVILSGNTLYGTAGRGGSAGYGTVFAVNTDGTGFTNLHSFMAMSTNSSGNYTNSDGAIPEAGLILSGNTLYGTADTGGSSGNGTVFAVNTDGTGFTNLHSFTATPPRPGPYVNGDGANPYAGLILSGNTLYGTAVQGGSSGYGTVFAVNTDGTGFTNLYSFTDGSDGAYPYAGLILSGNTLYGAAFRGGSSGNGTVFSLSLPPPPQLTIIPSGANVILTWPTNAAGFTLQSTTNLVAPAVWSIVSPGPVIVNGQFAVTNAITGTQQFYQLSQ